MLLERAVLLSGIIAGIVLDGITKLFAIWRLGPNDCLEQKHPCPTLYPDGIDIIGEYLRFEYHENTGVAFGFPIEGIFLKVITIALIAGIIIYWYREERVKWSRLIDGGFACIISGAIGNAIERISQGYVTDFIALKGFAVFNVADILIGIGAWLFIVKHLYDWYRHEHWTNRAT